MTDARAGAFVRAAIDGAAERMADRLRAEGAATERARTVHMIWHRRQRLIDAHPTLNVSHVKLLSDILAEIEGGTGTGGKA